MKYRSECSNCGLTEQHRWVLQLGCCTRCAAPMRHVSPSDIDLLRYFALLLYGDGFNSMRSSSVALLCEMCTNAAEIDVFVESVISWRETAEFAHFVAIARDSNYGPHRQLLLARRVRASANGNHARGLANGPLCRTHRGPTRGRRTTDPRRARPPRGVGCHDPSFVSTPCTPVVGG